MRFYILSFFAIFLSCIRLGYQHELMLPDYIVKQTTNNTYTHVSGLCHSYKGGEIVPRPIYAFIPYDQQNATFCSFKTCDGKGGFLYLSYSMRPIVIDYDPITNNFSYYFAPLSNEEKLFGTPYYPWPLLFPPKECASYDRIKLLDHKLFNEF